MSFCPVYWAWLLSFLFAVLVSFGQNTSALSNPATSDSSPVDAEARQLVWAILLQAPAKETSFDGVLKIRDANGKRTDVPLKYAIVPEEGGWRGIYETPSTPWRGAERLIIIHRDHQPNDY